MMTKKSKLKSGKTIDYGLGFALSFEGDSLKYYSHNGAGTGFSSMLIINPNLKTASVHLINIRDRNLGSPAMDLIQIHSSGNLLNPTKTLSEELMKTYMTSGIDSTIKRLAYIYTNELSLFTLNEDEALFFSKDLIELNRIPDAITYLKDILKLYQKSFKVTIAIGDAYLKDNNHGLALRYYKLAAQINSSNSRVNNLIKRLSGR